MHQKSVVQQHMTSITVFSMHALPRPKNGQPNLDLYLFSDNERLIRSKRNLKGSLFIKFEENCFSRFFIERATSET